MDTKREPLGCRSPGECSDSRADRLPLPEIHAKDCNCFGGCGCTAAKTDSRCKALRAAILAYGRSEYERGGNGMCVRCKAMLDEALNSGDGSYRP